MGKFYLCTALNCNRKYLKKERFISHMLNDHQVIIDYDPEPMEINKDNKAKVHSDRNKGKQKAQDDETREKIRREKELEKQAQKQFENENKQEIMELNKKYLEIQKNIVNNIELCGICLDNKADSCTNPCGHLNFCNECINDWFKTNKKCPTCRSEISSIIKVYK